MKIVDRYVFSVFWRVFLICCVCLTGIYVIGDFVEKLDDFIDASKDNGGLLRVMTVYYLGRVPWFLDMIGRVAALIAGVFAVTWLQRNNEMTALMAAGISRWRVLRPVVLSIVIVAVVSAINREAIIPSLRDQLSEDIRDWSGKKGAPISPQFDYLTDMLLDGQEAIARERRIIKPEFRLPRSMSHFSHHIKASNAVRQRADTNHPEGYLLTGVSAPANLAQLDAVHVDGRPVIYTPASADWLEPNQCFVVSYVKFGQLLRGRAWRQFASTKELVRGLANPSMNYGADVRVAVHARILQPFLDVTLFFLGIPVVLSKESRNVFVAAGSVLLFVGAYFIIVLASHSMGMNYLLSPSLAAWCPVLIMVPWATARSGPLRR